MIIISDDDEDVLIEYLDKLYYKYIENYKVEDDSYDPRDYNLLDEFEQDIADEHDLYQRGGTVTFIEILTYITDNPVIIIKQFVNYTIASINIDILENTYFINIDLMCDNIHLNIVNYESIVIYSAELFNFWQLYGPYNVYISDNNIHIHDRIYNFTQTGRYHGHITKQLITKTNIKRTLHDRNTDEAIKLNTYILGLFKSINYHNTNVFYYLSMIFIKFTNKKKYINKDGSILSDIVPISEIDFITDTFDSSVYIKPVFVD